MIQREAGASLESEAPVVQVGLGLASTCYNYSALEENRKPFDQTIFTRYDREGITAQLQAYLDLGLTPIPLRGKIPIVKWIHGNWNPRSIADLKKYIGRYNDIHGKSYC